MRLGPLLAALGLVGLVARLASASSSAVTWTPDPDPLPPEPDAPDDVARLDAESARLQRAMAGEIEAQKAAIRRGDRYAENAAAARYATLRDARSAVERQRTAAMLSR